MSGAYPDQVMRETAYWARWFSASWNEEVPLHIHSGEISADGSPQWHPDFERWIDGREKAPNRRHRSDQRLRTTKVMRRLRRVAVREYEVCYRVFALGERLEETTAWLNERAIRNGIPFPPHRPNGPHYVQKDTLALIVAAIAYAKEYW